MSLKGQEKHVGQNESLELALQCLMQCVVDQGSAEDQASLAQNHREVVLTGVVTALRVMSGAH